MENDFESTLFFSREYEIKLNLHGKFETFNDYREVFDYFSRFDIVYSKYTQGDSLGRTPFLEKKRYTRVTSISQGSLEIGVFIEKHWLELFILFLASYKDIKQNSIEAFSDFNRLVDKVESTIQEVTSDFPNFEMDQISEFIIWFKTLNRENQDYILWHIKRGERVFNKIKKIVFKN